MIEIKKHFLIITLCIVALLSLWWFRYQINVKKKVYQKDLAECRVIKDQLYGELIRLNEQHLNLIEYKKYLEECNLIKSHQIKWSKLLKQLAHNIPHTIWLEKLTAKQRQNQSRFIKVVAKDKLNFSKSFYDLSLIGKATNPKSIKTFITNLDNSIYFNNKSLKIFNQQNLIWQFQIKSNLNK